MKFCKYCHIIKSLIDFNIHPKTKDGHSNKCKSCEKKYKIEYKKKNPNAFKKWQEKNPDYDKQRITTEERKLKIKDYCEKNKEKRNEYNRNYKKKNRKLVSEYAKEYCKKRKKTDINFRLLCNLRNRIRYAIIGNIKSNSTISLLGCSPEEVKNYLQKKFKTEMNWLNYGSYWEIDHIVPCSFFNLSLEEQQRKCFHYTNLQPLTVHENRVKQDKILQD
ncbi:MAG: hypothetical protein AABY22_35215 [Nanoarchaeota archaeon]